MSEMTSWDDAGASQTGGRDPSGEIEPNRTEGIPRESSVQRATPNASQASPEHLWLLANRQAQQTQMGFLVVVSAAKCWSLPSSKERLTSMGEKADRLSRPSDVLDTSHPARDVLPISRQVRMCA